MIVNLKAVPDNQGGGPLPLGKYACRMHVIPNQVDTQGSPMLDGDNNPAPWRTTAGDPMWKLEMLILDGPYKGRKILDQISFGAAALKRVKIIYVRAGLAKGDEEKIDLQPDDLEGTMWYVTIDRLEESKKINPKTNKPYMNGKTAFDGYEVMDAETAARLSKVAAEASAAATAETADDLPF